MPASESPIITLQEIADMHACPLSHARDVIVKLPGFPKPAPTSTPRVRRWLRAEVLDFINRRTPAR